MLFSGSIFQRIRIDRLDFAVVFGVEASPCFLAKLSRIHKLLQQVGRLKGLALLVAFDLIVQILRHIEEHVEPHQVSGAEGGRLRAPYELARERVDLFDCVVALGEKPDSLQLAVHAHAIANKVWHVVGDHDALAQVHASKLCHALHEIGRGISSRNQLKQLQVARRIEEVCAQKALLERIRAPFRNLVDRQTAGVGGDDGIVSGMLLHAFVDAALDVHALDHRLNDPVGFADAFEIVIEVTQRDALGCFVVHKWVGTGFARLLKALVDYAVGVVIACNVEQMHVESGIGQVGGNLCAHGACPQHSRRTKWAVRGGRGHLQRAGGYGCRFHKTVRDG